MFAPVIFRCISSAKNSGWFQNKVSLEKLKNGIWYAFRDVFNNLNRKILTNIIYKAGRDANIKLNIILFTFMDKRFQDLDFGTIQLIIFDGVIGSYFPYAKHDLME